MAADYGASGGSVKTLSTDITLGAAQHWTIAGWVIFDSFTNGLSAIGMGATGDNENISLGTLVSTGQWKIYSNAKTPGNGTAASTATWYSAIMNWDGTQISSWANGTSQHVVTPSSAITWASINTFDIGRRTLSGAASQAHDGKLAEVAMWNVSLDAAERAALDDGMCPMLVRPSALIHYVPLKREILDRVHSGAFTNGTVAPIAHPRIYYPSARTISVPAAVGSAFQPAWTHGSNVVIV